MQRKRRGASLWAALVCSAVLAAAAPAGATVVPTGWKDKVDASVLTDAAQGQAQFLVYLKEKASLTGAAALGTKELKGRFVFEQLRRTARATQGPVLDALERDGKVRQAFWIVNAVHASGGLEAVQAVASLTQVERVYAIHAAELDLPDVDPPGGSAGGSAEDATVAVGPSIDHVRANQAWALGFRGQGVVVAGADTGVRWTHDALKRQYRGWDSSTNSADHRYNWHDAIKNPNPSCPGSSPEPCDDDEFLGGGHGTHTVGTIVGDDGGANQIGMAPDAKWIACRNMNHGLGVVPTYLECMEWFMAPTDASGANPRPDRAPDVINNSWGCVEACAPPLLKDLADSSREAGIVYVVSAGNDGRAGCSTVAFPLAVYQSVFTVGATGATADTIASFSSRGPVLTNPLEGIGYRKPDITAPGVGIRSAQRANDSAYGNLSGTSMAGPHVAGLVALVISANPALRGNVDRIEEIIERTAVPRTTTQGCGGDSATAVPNNVYGHGRIDALAAVKLAANKAPDARDDEAATEEETPVTVSVLANDSDPEGDAFSLTGIDSEPGHGTAVQNADDTITYTPAAGFAGRDSFSYRVTDVNGNAATATVRVDVDAGDIPGGCGEIDDSGAGVVYRHGWDLRDSSDATHGAYRRRGGSSKGVGTSPTATLPFDGDRVAIGYAKSSKGGAADVLVDGIPRGSISFASEEASDAAPSFGHTARFTGLGPGSHTLEVRYRSGVAYLDGFAFSCPR